MILRAWAGIIAVTLLTQTFSYPARAESHDPDNAGIADLNEKTRWETLKSGVKQCVPFWSESVKNFRRPPELAILGGASGAGIIAWQFNDKISRKLRDDDVDIFPAIADDYGRAINLGFAQFGVYLIGVGVKSESIREFGILTTHAAILSGAIAITLKFIVNSDRPDGSSVNRFSSSFPSGHATGSAALAGTVQGRYGTIPALPFHAAAIFTGITRVMANKHRSYEVIAGWGLGYATGIAIAQAWWAHLDSDRITFVPWMDEEGRAWLSFKMRFGQLRRRRGPS